MKIMVSAGEVSGDVHGAHLVKELKKIRSDIHFFGMGSEKLASEGVDVRLDISRRGTIGIFEALPNIIPIYFAFLKMKKMLLQERPDLVLLVDSQGFNMPFARFCKRSGFKTVYYIAPQEWLWGTPQGVKQVSETIDLIVAIFKKEYDVYRGSGANVVYFGHPLIDRVKLSGKVKRAEGHRPVISICPGSRDQEIKGIFPILLKSANLIKREIPAAKFIIPVPSPNIADAVSLPAKEKNIEVITDNTYEALSASDLAICTSGTINLEASILGVPNIMIYKLSPFTYFIGKHILKIGDKMRYFSMPNILLDQSIVPELIMKEANPRRISEESLSILNDVPRQKMMAAAFDRLRLGLGTPGVVARCARSILEII